MDRSFEFISEVRRVKKIKSIPVTTDDIIKPKLVLCEFIRNAESVYKRIEMVEIYILQFSKEITSKRKSANLSVDDEFDAFDREVEALINNCKKDISMLKDVKHSFPLEFSKSIIDDINDCLKDVVSSHKSAVSAHTAYRCISAILNPSSTSFSSKTTVKRSHAISSTVEKERILETVSAAEKDRIIDESIQIEKSMQHEVDAFSTGRQVEVNARELSSLVSTFNDHIIQQHDMVETIYDNTEKANDYVDKGFLELVKAESNNKSSTWLFSMAIILLAIILLIFNWLKK